MAGLPPLADTAGSVFAVRCQPPSFFDIPNLPPCLHPLPLTLPQRLTPSSSALGAAGLFCAAQAGQLGLNVLLIDHAEKVAEKIRISGGGRCNFTNRDLDVRAPHKHYVGQNPQFCRSALSRYTPADFIALMDKHGIPYEEKHKGQLFATTSAEDIIRHAAG